MRAVHVIASSDPGGGSDHVLGLLPELGRLGIESEVVTSPGGDLVTRLGSQGTPTHLVDMMRSRLDPRVPVALRAIGAIARADVIHCHGTRAAFFAQAARIGPTVYTAHGLSFHQPGALRRAVGLGAEAIACRADEVISVSRADLAALRQRRLLGADEGHHVPNAVDARVYAPGDGRASRLRIGIDPDAVVVGTVARLVPIKGVDVLIEAMREVPGATLLVVGDGPSRRELEERARPIAERVRFLGLRDDVPAILPALDLFVLSSRREGEPLALLQAMSCGLACVASATGGAAELLAGGRGEIVPTDDRARLAGVVRSLLANPDRRLALGRAARELALERSWSATAARVARIYHQAAGSTAGDRRNTRTNDGVHLT